MWQGDSIELELMHFTMFGKDVIRNLNLHPDTFVQLALQFTYYRMYQKYV